MTGHEYAQRIANYLVKNFGDRGISVYREIHLGKSIIGKNRRLDILVVHEATQEALVLECKYQDSQGTVVEKIPYALADLEAMPMPGYLVYAGTGFSDGVVHLLQAAKNAAACLPDEDLCRTRATSELDHVICIRFRWWDVLVAGKKAVTHS